jgi:hypothetical protein
MLEGNFWPSISVYSKEHGGGNWYDVPYKIMLPKRGQGANLLVPVALSASAVAFSSTRIENMYLLQSTPANVSFASVLIDSLIDSIIAQLIIGIWFRKLSFFGVFPMFVPSLSW